MFRLDPLLDQFKKCVRVHEEFIIFRGGRKPVIWIAKNSDILAMVIRARRAPHKSCD